MSAKLHLFIGFGDIAAHCSRTLLDQGDRVVGVSRSKRNQPDGIEWLQGDAGSTEILEKISQKEFASAVITLSPDTYDEQAYRQTYFDVSKALLGRWQIGNAPKKIIFVSSTSVYAQTQDEVVDESSEANPVSPTGKILRETENLFFESALNTIVLRFSGIYGPGRDYLIRQVRQGIAGNDAYTNRIHIDDCVGVICFLLNKECEHNLYLASDSEPVKGSKIREWMADRIGGKLALSANNAGGRGGSKRCCNRRLIEEGYRFLYSSYREGYTAELTQNTTHP
ncbi:MAG: NAD-dependent epimerase/dehydratase family protein [Agarilytica sp.]